MIGETANKDTWLTIKEASDMSGRSVNSLRLLIHRGKLRQIKKVKGKGHGEWLINSSSLEQITDFDLSNRTGHDISETTTSQNLKTDMSDMTGYNRQERLTGQHVKPDMLRHTSQESLTGPDIQPDMSRHTDTESSERLTGQQVQPDMSEQTGQDHPENFTSQNTRQDMSDWMGQENSKPMIPLEYYDSRRDEWMQERDSLLQGLMMYRYKFEELDRKLKVLPAPPEYVKARMDELEQHLQEKEQLTTQYEEKIALVSSEKEALNEEYVQAKTTYEEYIEQYRQKLEQEERQQNELKAALEAAAAELTHLRRPWWKKLFGAK